MAYYLYTKLRDRQRFADATIPGPQAPAAISSHERTTDPSGKLSATTDGDVPRDEANAQIMSIALESSTDNECATAVQENQEQGRYRHRVLAGISFPLLTFSLNQTMIAAALPFIASDFHQFAQLNWIVVAEELTATAFIPAWGQFADIFGRYLTLQLAVLISILGSALSAGAPITNFAMLLAGRGLQGVGFAGMMILTRIILSDKVSLKDNAINNTAFTMIAGIGFGVGPVIGGYLTSTSWRWIFILNCILGVVGLPITHFVSRTVLLGPRDPNCQATTEAQQCRIAPYLMRLSSIDFGGQLLFLFGMGLFVLALTWAGEYYPWNHVNVIVPLAIGVSLLIVFLVWEYLLLPGHALQRRFPNQRGMIPLKILCTRNAGILVYINMITGMAMYAVFYFVDLYFTLVRRFGSKQSGTNLLYYLPGLGAGAYISVFICNVWPRKSWYPLATGTLIEAVGITLLATALHWDHLPIVYVMLAITGIGTGLRFMPNTLHAVGYHRQDVATIISLMGLAVSLGSTLASTMMLNIFNNHLSSKGISLVRGASSASSFDAIDRLPQAQQDFIRTEAKQGLVVAFYAICSFMWVGVVAASFLGNVTISKKKKVDATAGQDGGGENDDLTKGSYIASLFRHRAPSNEKG